MPNARPGSITTASSPGSGCSHGGPIQRPPTRAGRWNARQRVLPARLDRRHLDVGERGAHRARPRSRRRRATSVERRRPSPTPRSRRERARARRARASSARSSGTARRHADEPTGHPSSKLSDLVPACRRPAPRTARRRRTVNANGSCGAISRSAMLATASRRRRPSPTSAIVRCGTGSHASPYGGNSGKRSQRRRRSARRTARAARARARRGASNCPTPVSSAANDANAGEVLGELGARSSSSTSTPRANGKQDGDVRRQPPRDRRGVVAAAEVADELVGRHRHEQGGPALVRRRSAIVSGTRS